MLFEKTYEFEDDRIEWRVTLDEPTTLNDFVHILLENTEESGKLVDTANNFLLEYDKGVITDINTETLGTCGNVQFTIILCVGTEDYKTYTIPLDI